MATSDTKQYMRKRKKLSSLFFETALPNEYLVQIGATKVKPVLGGRRFRLFRKFLRIPASIQTLEFSTDNANIHFQGLGIEGFASWQIDPERPDVAVQSLDLFDEDDPMAPTNHELRLICVEAVRHVIANMTIEDAHRKKDDIARDLKAQLQRIEEKWGIVFHQVGIRHVRVMSEAVFNDLQAKYRNDMRLEAERTRLETEQQIALEANTRNEKTRMEQLTSERKLEMSRLEKEGKVEEAEIEKNRMLAEHEHDLSMLRLEKEQQIALEANTRNEKTRLEKLESERKLETGKLDKESKIQDAQIAMRQLQVEREHELSLTRLEKEGRIREAEIEQNRRMEESNFELETLKLDLQRRLKEEQEIALLEVNRRMAEMNKSIETLNIDVDRMRRAVEQTFSDDARALEMIRAIPKTAGALKIDNYSIMDGSGNGVSPISRVIQEVATTLKANNIDLAGVLGANKTNDGS